MARPVNKLPPIHPGELLREDMDALGLSARALADAIAVPHNRIAAILRGERSITADTALRLAVYFGTSADVWMNLQMTSSSPLPCCYIKTAAEAPALRMDCNGRTKRYAEADKAPRGSFMGFLPQRMFLVLCPAKGSESF